MVPPDGGTFTGSTTGGVAANKGTCADTAGAPERVYQWTPNSSGVADIETCSATLTTFDTVLYLRQSACDVGTQIACNDDTTGCAISLDGATPRRGSRATPTVTAGQTYYIFVDGYGSNSGSFSLSVTAP